MAGVRWFLSTLLAALVSVCGAAEHDFPPGYTTYSARQEYIRHIHFMFNANRGEVGGRLITETDALIDTKYRTWKRSADLINSLLGLPKGMNSAGR